MYGKRVELGQPEQASWYAEQGSRRDYSGTVVGEDDGLYVVRLDRPIHYNGLPYRDVTTQRVLPMKISARV